MAKLSLRVKAARSQNFLRANIIGVHVVDVRVHICASLICAESVSANLALHGEIPGVLKASW